MQTFKPLWKYFVILFLLMVIIFNWAEISWIFNYRVVSSLISDFLKKIDILPQKEEPVPEINLLPVETTTIEEKTQYQYVEKENSIEIPKIAITAPLVLAVTPEQKEISGLHKLLDSGVVHYPYSALPGEPGVTVILGHSAPVGWPKIKYDWVFSDLNKLESGDEVFINFNHHQYPYRVKEKVILEKGGEIPQPSTDSKNILVLVSCWPPGKDLYRIAVFAEIVQ